MSNRFDKVPTRTEHVSSYIPLPLDYMQSALNAKQKTYDDSMAAADDLETIQGGYRTGLHAQKLRADRDAAIQDVVSEAEQSDNWSGVDRKIKGIAKRMKENPMYVGVKEDEAMKAQVSKDFNDPLNRSADQSAYDYDTGRWNELDVNTPFTSDAYRMTKAGNTGAEYKPEFDQMKAIYDKTLSDPNIQEMVGPDGQSYMRIMSEGKETSMLTRDYVRDLITNAATNDPNFLNRQSRIYADALDVRKGGKGLTPEQHVDQITDSFMGVIYKDADIKNISSPGTGSGGGSGNIDLSTIPNDILKAQKGLDTKGEAQADEHTIAAFIQGEYKAGKGIAINVRGDETSYLTVPKLVKKDGEAGEKTSREVAIQAKSKWNTLKKKTKKVLEEKTLSQEQYTDPKNGNLYYIDASGTVHEQSQSGKKTMSLDQFIATQDEGIAIFNDADKNGINMFDEKYSNKSFDDAVEEDEFINEWAVAIKGLNGSMTVNTNPNSNNLFTGSDENSYANLTLDLTEAEIEEALPEWEKALDYKMIRKATKADKDGNFHYTVPLSMQINSSVENAVADQMQSKYSDKTKVQELIVPFQEANKAYMKDRDTKKQSMKDNREFADKIKDQLEIGANEGTSDFNYSNINTLIETVTGDDYESARKYGNKLDEIELDEKSSEEEKATARLLLEYEIYKNAGDENAERKYNSLLKNIKGLNTDSSKKKDLGFRNNNPGNIMSGGKYKEYDTIEDGFNAMVKDLSIKKSGVGSTGLDGNSTISELIGIYSPKDDNKTPALKGNNPVRYAKGVAEYLGVSLNTKLSDIDVKDLARAMVKIESPDSYRELFGA